MRIAGQGNHLPMSIERAVVIVILLVFAIWVVSALLGDPSPHA